MHGQKRSEYKSRLIEPESARKLATKALQWNHLSHELLTMRQRLRDDATPPDTKPSPELLLTLTEKMLSVNPDPSHLWNVRREMLLHPAPTVASPDAVAAGGVFDVRAELTLTAHCLGRNPKSYAAWWHRKWSLVHFTIHPAPFPVAPPPRHVDATKAMLRSELGLCAEFLQLDERNFHCWNYRRFVVALLGSCGGASSSDVRDTNVDARPDMELFNGSWSPWLNVPKVMMGGQLSNKAVVMTGSLLTNTDDGPGTSGIGRLIVPLSRQELNKLITDEWDFTSSKIQDNFSNGSAFHYRSKLLPLVLETRLSCNVDDDEGDDRHPDERSGLVILLAREEWEDVLLNAVFTEPDDQTPWWYHRFIVSWAKPSNGAGQEAVDSYEALLFDMADSLRDLLEVEKENDLVVHGSERHESKGAKCKWAYIGLHLVLSTLLESTSLDEDTSETLKEEGKACLMGLTEIDPDRLERYQNLMTELKGE